MSVQSWILGIVWQQRKLLVEIAAVGGILLVTKLAVTPYLTQEILQNVFQGLGLIGPLLFVWISAIWVMLFAPPILAIGLGSLAFGNIAGACYSLLGITTGSCLSFLVGRHLIGNLAVKLKSGRLKKIDQLVKCDGFLCIFGLRLVFFSMAPLNYAAGATTVTFKEYIFGTFVGLVPKTFILSFAFEMLQQPSVLLDLMSHPSFLVLWLLPLTRLAGISLLVALLRSHRGYGSIRRWRETL